MNIPKSIQKHILYLLLYELKLEWDAKDHGFLLLGPTIGYLVPIYDLVFVCKEWFIMSKQFIKHHYFFEYKRINNNNNNDEYKLITKESVQNIIIDYIEINNRLIDSLNKEYHSLRSISIRYMDEGIHIGISPCILNHLNKLVNKDRITVNICLELDGYDVYRELEFDHEGIELELESLSPFQLETNVFQLVYDHESEEIPYSFTYDIIKHVNPKTLSFTSIQSTDVGSSHLCLYHSISKLNHRYSSIIIEQDFIPLYAFYRFLQSPHLQTFKCNLQFHFISALYIYNSDNTYEYDFNRMDDSINENDQEYCPYNIYGDGDRTVPPYSLSLWKQCLQLLSNNKTITELSLGASRCGTNCVRKYTNPGLFEPQLVQDLLDALSTNQSIKSLDLDFTETKSRFRDQNHSIINNEFFSSLLQRNKALESINISPSFRGPIIEETIRNSNSIVKIKEEIEY
ncbi:hypothetical protein CYY_006994 [Polysphondylium violaceum]|uniref:Uncharacterized protein n=1 Tax=Polysphondylium violaceum TaxID=133409 RepID=A0A8J4PQ76_9MYCE|nr:hypothetical protein CYY_006994 [Polysphondylium violaceum]